jgi:hypothetical protein
MKFLCIAYEDERKLDQLSRSEWLALRQETLDYVETLRKQGRLIVTHALQSAASASTVRVRGGKPLVTDGPFAETKEQLGGFFLIEASDQQEAIHVAARWPSASIGSIEVRPIEEKLRIRASSSARYSAIRLRSAWASARRSAADSRSRQ